MDYSEILEKISKLSKQQLDEIGVTEFDIKELKFLDKHDITFSIDKKTGKLQPSKNYYMDENLEFKLGMIPPLIHYYEIPKELGGGIKEVPVCKFCWNALPEMDEKGHDMRFCNVKHKIRHLKICIDINKRKEKDPSITGITWSPQLVKDEEWFKDGTLKPREYKVPEKIDMVINTNKSKNEVEQIPLSTKKWTKKDV